MTPLPSSLVAGPCRALLVGASAVLAVALVASLATVAAPPGHTASRQRSEPGAAAASRVENPSERQVLAISVDGLNPRTLRRLGRGRAPHLWRLVDEGAATLNARTSVEQTVTLPNHTGMVTGRRIKRRHGGHGVTWNHHRPGSTVQEAAGHGVGSVFSRVARAGRRTALFATKQKLSLFARSWPDGVHRVTIRPGDDLGVLRRARADLVRRDRAFTFLHLGGPDAAGHQHGFRSRGYRRAVRRVDELVGKLLRAVDRKPALRDLTILLTADHGGPRGTTHHGRADRPANYTVPFLAWGPGIASAGLYRINPDYRYPGSSRPGYQWGRQPVRNGDLANLALDLLGLGPVPGSLMNAEQNLRVR